jgi:protein-L-isoaspartate(D-aspartate) O-methyltransferase
VREAHVRRSWRRVLLALALFGTGALTAEAEDAFTAARLKMVTTQIEARGVRDPRVLDAMRRVERHRFVPERLRDHAHDDRPLPIGHEQTISQPYIVALMTEEARVKPGARVLEIGTGSGYQAAVLSVLAGQVYSIEIVEPLAREAAARLETLGYRNVTVRAGDGYRGWPERAPFDAILVTAAPPEIPQPLLDQLAVGGRLVAPVGEGDQELVVVERTAAGLQRRRIIPVRFVPMTGEAQRRR